MGLLSKIIGEKNVTDYDTRIDKLRRSRAEKVRMAEQFDEKISEEIVATGTSVSSKQAAGFRREIADYDRAIADLTRERDARAAEDAATAERVSWETLEANCAEFEEFGMRIEKAVDDLRILIKVANQQSVTLPSSAPRLRPDWESRHAFAGTLLRLISQRLEGGEASIVTAFKEHNAMTLWFKPRASERDETSNQPSEPAANNQ